MFLRTLEWFRGCIYYFGVLAVQYLFLSQRTLVAEKSGQQLSAFFSENSRDDLDAMVQSRILAELKQRANGAGFGIVASIDELCHSRVDDRSGAHWARLKRHDDNAIDQSPIVEIFSRFAQREEFGMSGGIAIALPAVVSAADDLPAGLVHDDRADGHFIERQCFVRLGDRKPHPLICLLIHKYEPPRRQSAKKNKFSFVFLSLWRFGG
jgi:hypothetical protein